MADSFKELVSGHIQSALKRAFEEDGAWQQDTMQAVVKSYAPSESVISVRLRNIIAGQTEYEERHYRVRITEVK